MGLIKAIVGATGGVLADQWKEYFYCDSISPNTLICKGQKKTSSRSSNKKGEDNIISDGSVISVNEGQCMLIVDGGKVVDICAEAGEYTYDSKTSPSLFTGSFGEGVKNTFKTIGYRFTFGGDTGRDQRVYYINTKEIIGNKYGTATPVPFRVVDAAIGLDIDISIRCFGEYSYKITDPILFYTNVSGNVSSSYGRENLDSMLKTELLTALQPAFASVGAKGIRYSALPAHTSEVADALNSVLSEKWSEKRGISVASFGINSVSASPEDEALIKDLQRKAVYRNASMGAATLVDAQAEAMKNAAANNGGAMLGFMGMNMAQNAGGVSGNIGTLYNMAASQPAPTPAPAPTSADNSWTCSCGAKPTGKFCTECGAKRPEDNTWTCTCGNVNRGKFCSECGAKRPAGAPVYACDKCGWKPEDPKNPPKFCPECGDKFDSNDIQ